MTERERAIANAAWWAGRQAQKAWLVAILGGIDMTPPQSPYLPLSKVRVSSTGSWLPERNGAEE
jgi:hypothetical protein